MPAIMGKVPNIRTDIFYQTNPNKSMKILACFANAHAHIGKAITIKNPPAMKLMVLLFLAACLQAAMTVKAQSVTISAKDASLESVFARIERQTGYQFFYKDGVLRNSEKVSMDIKAELSDALRRLFQNQPLTYEIVDKTIVVKPKPKTVSPNKNSSSSIQTITGLVLSDDGRPLRGASVRVKGTEVAAMTEAEGRFSIIGTADDAILVVSFIGYQSREISAQANDMVVRLTFLSSFIDEVSVVSTGYQTLPKERATGSFSKPNRQMFESRVSTDVLSRLEGITNGVVFNSPGVTGAQGHKISIRGRSTLYANDNPLIVVDNFPYDGNINNINPNDIEDITILKDAAAASIWGVQAGNGVIVITTRKGKLSQPLKIEINSNLTTSSKPDLFYDRAFLNSSDFIELEKFLFSKGHYDWDLSTNDPSNPDSRYTPLSPVVSILDKMKRGLIPSEDGNKLINDFKNKDIRTDLSKHFYRSSLNQQYSASLRGGSDKTTYYLSAGYDRNLENLAGSRFNRITFNSHSTHSPLKNLVLTAGINYIQSNSVLDNTLSQVRTGGNYSGIYPYANLTDDDGNGIPIITQYSTDFINLTRDKGFLSWEFNPLEELENGYNTESRQNNDLRISSGLKYSFMKGLNLDVKYQYQKIMTSSNNLATAESFNARYFINRYSIRGENGNVTGYNMPVGAILRKSFTDSDSHHARGSINYDYSSPKHNLTAIAGVEITQVTTESSGIIKYGYNEALGTARPVDNIHSFLIWPDGYSTTIQGDPDITGTIDRFRSYFSNAAYTFLDKYTISASGRIDASNYFGVKSNQKAVPLWSAGAKWDIHKEQFYRISWLDVLKLRASFGYQGNLDKSLSAVPTLRVGSLASYTNAPKSSMSNFGNPELRWERNRTINLGLDFELKGKRLAGSLEYYTKKGLDLIGFTILPPSSGVINMKGNYSGTQGKGVDLQLNSKNLTGRLEWNSAVLFSWASDKVTKYTGANISPTELLSQGYNITPVIGRPAFSLYSYKWAGLDPVNGDPRGFDAEGQISKDYSVLTGPSTIEELAYSGSARPTKYGGIYNSFKFCDFSLSFNLSYKFDYFIRRQGLNYEQLFYTWAGNKEYEARWQKTGDEQITQVPSQIYPSDGSRDYFYQFSSATIEKGDHIRLQDITLSYDLTKAKFPRLPFESIKLYAYANNIAILWRANSKGLDPDFPAGGIPLPRTFSLGLKLFL